MMHGQKNIKSC